MSIANSVPARVRADARAVMRQARFLRINDARLQDYARMLVAQSRVVTALDQDNHYVSANSPEDSAAYVFALDSINFGSGVFHLAQAAGLDLEYHVVAQGLKNAFAEGAYRRPESWHFIEAPDCHRLFGLPQGRVEEVDRLMAGFAAHLRATARALDRDFGGIGGLLRHYKGQGETVLEIVSRWAHFADVAQYNGMPVAIYKRAQILLADLELALAPQGGSWFGGLSDLTCFADNMVPHVLRCEGVLDYDAVLAARIDAGTLIIAGSPEETELRCAAIDAVERLKETLGGDYTSVNLDHMIWHRGYEQNMFGRLPHRTISIWY